jgi:hypothetical protein
MAFWGAGALVLDLWVLAPVWRCGDRGGPLGHGRLEGSRMISSTTIWGAIALFAILGAVLSWLATRENTGTAADYFVGGRNIGGVIAGLSYAATTY